MVFEAQTDAFKLSNKPLIAELPAGLQAPDPLL